MKKSLFMGAAALALFSLASCNSNCKTDTCDKGKCDDKDVVYTGVLPAADCDGVRYTLALDYDHHDNDGDYHLVETYLKADSVAALGYKDVATFASEGDFTVVKQDGKTYLKLVKDVKDSSAKAVASLNFLVDSDSTITLVNDQLQPSENPALNYTLSIAK